MKILLIFILLASQLLAQTVYEIPFASKENEIEFTITNLNDLEIITKDLETKLLEIIEEYNPIINITRGTKIHTIVLYRLGQKYTLDCYYLPEGEKNIILLP